MLLSEFVLLASCVDPKNNEGQVIRRCGYSPEASIEERNRLHRFVPSNLAHARVSHSDTITKTVSDGLIRLSRTAPKN